MDVGHRHIRTPYVTWPQSETFRLQQKILMCPEFNAILLGYAPRIFDLLDPENGDIW
jgi:hypothetical protein